jgi:pimeloyl-ACP methyl ester carboxylesterase
MRKRGWIIFAAILILGTIVFESSLGHLVFSIRMALAFRSLASGETGQNLAVRQINVIRRLGNRDYQALLYIAEKKDASHALILAPGLSEEGCYHPRLVAFSRVLSELGFLVLTPDIETFRDFQISAEPIDQIVFWCKQVPDLEGSSEVKKTGLAGISYSGTLALMAAARPELRDRLAFVMGIGSYYDLIRCTREWFAAEASDNGRYPTRFYAKWIVMLSALEMIRSNRERVYLHQLLDSLILQKRIPSPDEELTAEGERWHQLAVMKSNQSDPQLERQIEQYLLAHVYRDLNPEPALDKINCPVFLVHGAYDDLIPARESLELHRRLAGSYLLVSPFLTHTHPNEAVLSMKEKTRALLDMLLFCYRFSRAAG